MSTQYYWGDRRKTIRVIWTLEEDGKWQFKKWYWSEIPRARKKEKPREQWMDEQEEAWAANTSQKKMQKTENFSGTQVLWVEGCSLYFRKVLKIIIIIIGYTIKNNRDLNQSIQFNLLVYLTLHHLPGLLKSLKTTILIGYIRYSSNFSWLFDI